MEKFSELSHPEHEASDIRVSSADAPIPILGEECCAGACGCGNDGAGAGEMTTGSGAKILTVIHEPGPHLRGEGAPFDTVKESAATQTDNDAQARRAQILLGEDVHEAVRTRYGQIAQTRDNCGCGCGPQEFSLEDLSRQLGYSAEDLYSAPDGANLGLGCGNPLAIATLQAGETVVDLGSGGGFDCFLASRRVGESGRVIGVDMTPAMITKARKNAEQGRFSNVEFRLGEIEHLPVADHSVDCILSNCVINMTPNKRQVFAEAYRILKPGGRLAISDIVATADIPPEQREDLTLWTNCMAGASLIAELEEILAAVGFTEIQIEPQPGSRSFIRQWVPGTPLSDYIVSAVIAAQKPESP